MAWQFATLEMRSQETGPSELFVKTSGTNGSVTRGAGEKLVNSCLVPRPHYCARPGAHQIWWVPGAADTFRVKRSERVHLVGYVAESYWPRRPGKTLYREARSVALQLCPPLQFGPLTYQLTECVFISSSQSELGSCLLHVTSQLGEGCSMSLFVSFSWCCGRLVYETVLERFPRWVFGEFYRSLKDVRNLPRSTHMFICWRARKPGTRMKVQASCPNKEFEEVQ